MGQCSVCAYWKRAAKSDEGIRGECRRNAPTAAQLFQVQIAALLGSLAYLAETNAEAQHDCPEYFFDSKEQFFVYEWPLTREDQWCGEFKRECKGDIP